MEKAKIDQITSMVAAVLAKMAPEGEPVKNIPVGISNRHIHLSAEHMAILFGAGASLTHQKDLKQVGEFAAAETLTLVGPKGVLRGVRVLGPLRNITQVEISRTDGFSLGVKAPVRDSGDLEASPGLVVVGPAGAITLKQGVICAARHIHMHDEDARKFGVSDGQRVTVETDGARGAVLKNVLVRVSPKFRLELHIDTDEANALSVGNGDAVRICRREEG